MKVTIELVFDDSNPPDLYHVMYINTEATDLSSYIVSAYTSEGAIELVKKSLNKPEDYVFDVTLLGDKTIKAAAHRYLYKKFVEGKDI